MLLIGDIHISSRYKDKIISGIRDFISKNNKQKNIVFLGDFVYHFSYDRKAILELFELFLDLYSQGKNIYILAGNHDWISESWIFQEAMRSFDILNKKSENGLFFIKNPEQFDIDGKKILFLPYNMDFFVKYGQESSNKKFETLLTSNNKNETFSGGINTYIDDYITENINNETYIFHHYYLESVQFPGQKSRFSFKDVAIAKDYLDNENLFMVSGHLHKSFCLKNYFCTGSVWNSSPLEVNEFKFLFVFDIDIKSLSPQPIIINPYIKIDLEDQQTMKKDNGGLFEMDSSQENIVFEKEILNSEINKIFEENLSVLSDGNYKIDKIDIPDINTKDISLMFVSSKIEYDDLKQILGEDLFLELGDIKIKKYNIKINQMNEMLDISNKNLQNTISDWKSLLKEYINMKFGQDEDKYIEILKQLKII